MNPLSAAVALALVPWGIADLALLSRERALAARSPPPWRRCYA